MDPARVERWLGAAMAAVGTVSPRLGGRMALRLFCTPMTPPPSSGARAWLAAADRHEVAVDGGTVACHEVGEGPPVLLVHGWSTSGSSLRVIADSLAAAGHRAVAVDLPAHGVSTGRTTNMLESARALGAVLRERGPFAGAVCHSFGAPALLLALELDLGPRPERLVTVGAPMDMDKVFSDYARRLRVPPAAERDMRARVDRIFGRPFLDYDIPAAAARFGDRLLVIHDTEDRDVPHIEGATMAGEHGTLLTTEGLGHNRVLRSREVAGRIVDFLS